MKVERKVVANAIEIIVLAAVFALLVILTFRPNWDIDIFWHMETGEWIVEHGELPSTDIFTSVDKTRPWTPFQWLYEVLTYETNARLGFTALRAAHSILYLLAFAGFYAAYRKFLPSRTIALALLLLTVVMSEDRFRIRPEAFNFFFTAIILPVLLTTAVTTKKRPSIPVIALLVATGGLWANIHAGGALTLAMASTAVFAAALVTRLARPDETARARLSYSAWVLAAGTLPMLPMPGFIKGVITAFTMIDESSLLIPEWHPPAAYFMPSMGGSLTDHTVICGIVPYLVFGIAMLAAGLGFVRTIGARGRIADDGTGTDGPVSRSRSTELGLLAAAVFFALLPVQSGRFIYMTPFSLLMLGMAARNVPVRLTGSAPARVVLMILAAVLFLSSFQNSVNRQRRGLVKAIDMIGTDLEPLAFPEGASDTISAMGLKGRIFHFTAWGGYLVGRHFPECDVFTDGRGNFNSAEREILIQSHDPWKKEAALEEAWKKYPFEILVFPRPVFPLMNWDRTKWMLVYRDALSEVFLRVNPENRANIERAMSWWDAAGVSSCGNDPVAFQEHYRKVIGYKAIRAPKIDAKLVNAASQAQSDSLSNRLSGLYDGALILFDAGLHEKASIFFKKIMDEGVRHSGAAMYLAWCYWLAGRDQDARQVLIDGFGSPDVLALPDHGRIPRSSKRILDELGVRLGLKQAAP